MFYFLNLKTISKVLLALAGVFFSVCCFAAAAGTTLTLSGIQGNITSAIGNVSQILMDISTIAGVGFVFASLFKFHQHKQNPTQVPLSNGIVLLAVGAALAVLPHLFGTASQAVFGTGISKAGSTDVQNIVTTKSS